MSALLILARLNRARARGHHDVAEGLQRELDARDRRRGYDRARNRPEPGPLQPGTPYIGNCRRRDPSKPHPKTCRCARCEA